MRNNMDRQPCIYMMASGRNDTIYTGVTSNILQRAYQHREGQVPGFTRQYGCKILVYFEFHATMTDAITREKQIKAGSRTTKVRLIETDNPYWLDLYDTLA